MQVQSTVALTLMLGPCVIPVQDRSHLNVASAQVTAINVDTLVLVDSMRQRTIPIAYYAPHSTSDDKPKLALISHGYGANRSGTYLHFSSLAEHLASNGWTVVSIQHELPGDEPLAMKGDLRVLRRPNWERGVANIHFVLKAMKHAHPALEDAEVALVGHSNGGDISMLFAETYPVLVESVVSLDNRRMPLPRMRTPKIRSVRANDAPADDGVLPTREEQEEFGIRTIHLPNTKHVDMDDRATEVQRKELNALVLDLLVN